jgi:hypothetical protein
MVEIVGMYIIGEICKQVLLIFRWMWLLHVHGVVTCPYDGIVGEPVKRLNFVMIKRVLGSNPVECRWNPLQAPPLPMSLTLGLAMACQVGSAKFFFCLIFWKRKSCDDNIGYLNMGYKVTQSVIFFSNFRCCVIG